MNAQRLQSFDLDTDALADTLDRLADGIRADEIAVTEVESTHRAVISDASRFHIGVRFHATPEFADLVDAIEYDMGAEDDGEGFENP